MSVSNNIAEGFERGTTNELLAFLYIARGSAGEVRSMLVLKERSAAKRGWPADLKSQISNLKSLAENCSRQIRGWADSLQNSDIKGQRHLTDKTRQADEQRKRVVEFDKKLRPSQVNQIYVVFNVPPARVRVRRRPLQVSAG